MSREDNKISPVKEAIDTSLKFNKKTLQDYEVLSVIGSGTFGTCFKVRDKENGNIFAWKGIDYDELSESQKESLVSEIRVLRQLKHPNIVQYFHYLINYEAKSVFIVMEWCEGGDLAQIIAKAKAENKRFEERYIWRVLFQVCRALQVCHNKIKEGIILHRDIKPANIFLDMEGNAKLGDFGLARMLRRNESFAETFVGTPYYMSPEIIKGFKYDCKSDVWAVGCLIYEMCSLRPPFKGKEFGQLSANISIGKYTSIPDIYSKDLQEIIAYMLEVEIDERLSIEVISRHPLLVRNINNLGIGFPLLVDIELQHQDFYGEVNACSNLDKSLLPDFSSTTFLEQNSFNEGYGQRRLNITGVFTPDLKAELFYSAKNKIYPFNSTIQLSDPELYESITRHDNALTNDNSKTSVLKHDFSKRRNSYTAKLSQPDEVTHHVFDKVLQERLQAIRAQESLLRQREENLHAREKQLTEKEKRLIAFEQNLILKNQRLNVGYLRETNTSEPPNSNNGMSSTPLPDTQNIPPPIPPRKPCRHDETYCSIEPNDITLLHQPTIAKLNIATLPAVKAFPIIRKVTFQSPKKFITYDIDSKPKTILTAAKNNPIQFLSSTSSKNSEDSSRSTTSTSSTTTTKRKSILSMFGLSRNNKDSTNSSTTSLLSSSATNAKASSAFANKTKTKNDEKHLGIMTKENIITKGQSAEISNIWTTEHKKAAFEMLAAMNAAESSNGCYLSNAPRHKIRHSIRDRNTLQRSRLRRSLMVPSRLPTEQREPIII